MNSSCILFLGPRLAAGTALSRHEQGPEGGCVHGIVCGACAAGGSQQGDRYHRYIFIFIFIFIFLAWRPVSPVCFAPYPTLPRARTHTLSLWRKCDCGTETAARRQGTQDRSSNTRPFRDYNTVKGTKYR
jgi:hypothetical protein